MLKAWKIYGAEGHRQRDSFGTSTWWDFGDRKIGVLRADVTNTHDYVVLLIEAKEGYDFNRELNGQISDGVFEDCRVGKVEEIQLCYD